MANVLAHDNLGHMPSRSAGATQRPVCYIFPPTSLCTRVEGTEKRVMGRRGGGGESSDSEFVLSHCESFWVVLRGGVASPSSATPPKPDIWYGAWRGRG